jgi:hypothetical protein
MKCLSCENNLIGKQTKWCSLKCKNKSGNKKYQNYECQKKRALERKIEIVHMSGGCCSKCGYKKNLAALIFHHVDAGKKEFKLDSRKLSNSTWDNILKELNKCKLLCSNCHAEEHYPHLDKWGGTDLNRQPTLYESAALTIELPPQRGSKGEESSL